MDSVIDVERVMATALRVRTAPPVTPVQWSGLAARGPVKAGIADTRANAQVMVATTGPAFAPLMGRPPRGAPR